MPPPSVTEEAAGSAAEEAKEPRLSKRGGGFGSGVVFTSGSETSVGSSVAAERMKSACNLTTFVRPTSLRW